MQLSEAIRLGSMLKPQAFDSGQNGKSCALEAAADAVGFSGYARWMQVCEEFWPWVHVLKASCPQCFHEGCDIHGVIYHLNDGHKWTRERIADWVAGVEAAQAHSEPAETNALDPSVQPQERCVRAGTV